MILNTQQLKVLKLVADGDNYTEIGYKVFLSSKRVEAIAKEIREALGARSMPHAVSIAYQVKILIIE